MASRSLLRGLTWLSLVGLIRVGAATQCYYPNGEESADEPCYDNGSATFCCGADSICLDNKLCLSVDQPFTLSRGSCTDKDWKSANCPLNLCQTAQVGAGASLVWLNGTGTDAIYCCDSVLVNQTSKEMICSDVNDSPQAPFAINNGDIIPGVTALSGLAKTSNSTASAVVSNTTCPSGSNSTSRSSSSNAGKEAAIGAGVGVPLGVISLLAIAWGLWERRQRKQAQQGASPMLIHDRNFAGPASELDSNPSYKQPPMELYAHARPPPPQD